MNNIFKFSIYIFLTLSFAWLAFVVGATNQYGDLEPTAESLEEDGSIPPDAELFPKSMAGIFDQTIKSNLGRNAQIHSSYFLIKHNGRYRCDAPCHQAIDELSLYMISFPGPLK